MKKLAVILLLTLGLIFFVSCEKPDTITTPDKITFKKIREYEFSKKPEDLKNWLWQERTDLENEEIYTILVDWSSKKPDEFITLVQTFDESQRKTFVKKFAEVATKTYQTEKFVRTYDEIKSVVGQELVERVKCDKNISCQ